MQHLQPKVFLLAKPGPQEQSYVYNFQCIYFVNKHLVDLVQRRELNLMDKQDNIQFSVIAADEFKNVKSI